jgi:hypothetical protein
MARRVAGVCPRVRHRGGSRLWSSSKRTFLSHGRGAEVPPATIAKTADRCAHHGARNDPLSPSRATGCPGCPGYADHPGTSMSVWLADCAAGARTRPFCPDCPGAAAVRTMMDHDHGNFAAYYLLYFRENRNPARSRRASRADAPRASSRTPPRAPRPHGHHARTNAPRTHHRHHSPPAPLTTGTTHHGHHSPRTTHHAPRTTHHAPRTTHHAPRKPNGIGLCVV